ncbi:MAG: hypothetical protein LBH00_03130 [Planctomycetaceae bacterium]|nr:hypothetical protein [Planctomycetaceae bacterium]
MSEYAEIPNSHVRIAAGIVVHEDTLHLLEKTVQSAKTFSTGIYVLVAGNGEMSGRFLPSVLEECTVLHGGWAEDDAATRNMLIDRVEAGNSADWLVWLNPGDEFDPATLEEFRQFLENNSHRDAIYMMVLHRLYRTDKVRHDFDEETIDARLMPLHKGVRFQGRVNASLLSRNAALMVQISAAPGRFFVPAKKTDPVYSKKCAEQTLKTLEKIENEGEVIQGELLTARAEAQFALGNFAACRRCLQQQIKQAPRSDLRLAAYYMLWETFAAAPIPDAEITKCMVEAMDHFPVDMQLLTFLGSHMQRIGKIDLAVRTFETAVKHGRISLDVWHRLRIREIAVTSLALALRLQGKNKEAIQTLEMNLELIEDRTEFHRHLLDLYVAESREEDACRLAAEIWGDTALDQIRLVLKGACFAKSGRWDLALVPLKEAYTDGCKDVLALRWYALTLLAKLQFKEALTILEEWIAVQPDNSEALSYYAAAQHPDRFGEMLNRIRNTHLKSLGIVPEIPRKSTLRIDDAVREMIQHSGAPSGKSSIITGFKPKVKPVEG